MIKILVNIVLLFILIISFNACENDIAVVNSITADAEKLLPDQSNLNAEFLYSDSAVVRAKLTTPQLDHYASKKPYFELPKGMNVVFYTAEKKEETKLTADYAIGYDNGNGMEKMEAKGNVIVVNVKGEKLNTEHLTWNALTKKIYTDDFVKITTKDQVIMGDGMVADQDFSNYEIKNIKGVIYTKDSLETKNEKK
jgi:LPS export ABC transporter protein LptC